MARARKYRTRERAGGGGCGAAHASHADKAGGLVVLEQAAMCFMVKFDLCYPCTKHEVNFKVTFFVSPQGAVLSHKRKAQGKANPLDAASPW